MCLKRVFAIVIQRSQLVLFYIVSENYGFLSQNATSEASNQYVHISISKGRKDCRSYRPCLVARAGCIKSCSAKHAAQRKDSRMGGSQTPDKIDKFSSNSNICYFYLKLIASIGKTLSLKCFQISLANIKSVRHN